MYLFLDPSENFMAETSRMWCQDLWILETTNYRRVKNDLRFEISFKV